MKKLAYLFIAFMIVGCSTNKVTYWCGDHPCINKKEKEAFLNPGSKKPKVFLMREM